MIMLFASLLLAAIPPDTPIACNLNALSPVERQSARYAEGLTASQQLQAWRLPLPFRYETTAAETHFTSALDPHPRANCTTASCPGASGP